MFAETLIRFLVCPRFTASLEFAAEGVYLRLGVCFLPVLTMPFLLLFLFQGIMCVQYVAIPYKMDSIDFVHLDFNVSFVSDTNNSPYERVDLPVVQE